jgi:hypothetical protein
MPTLAAQEKTGSVEADPVFEVRGVLFRGRSFHLFFRLRKVKSVQ